MISDLLLLSGNDIPFREARLNIHQPTLKEIGYIGEDAFFTGCELLNFSKDILNSEDRIHLENKSNFEIFMSIMKDQKNSAIQKNRINSMLLLTLMFPSYNFTFLKDQIAFKLKDSNQEEDICFIDKNNFEEFKKILVTMFCLKRGKGEVQDYNPQGEMARKIAEKLRKGREKAAAAKGSTKKISILSRYVSILTVGEGKNMNDILNLTVYQLFDEFERFELKQSYDAYIQARLAGAKDIEQVDNWMKELHSES